MGGLRISLSFSGRHRRRPPGGGEGRRRCLRGRNRRDVRALHVRRANATDRRSRATSGGRRAGGGGGGHWGGGGGGGGVALVGGGEGQGVTPNAKWRSGDP